MLLLPVFSSLGRVVAWDHGGSSWFPFGWANLSVFVSELEGLYKSKSLIYASSYWQVIDLDVSQDSVSVNDECASESNSVVISVVDENSIILRNLL